MGDGVMTEFMSFTQQVGDTIPVLQEMGYEVSTFRVVRTGTGGKLSFALFVIKHMKDR
jgi:hypothetical protein